MNKILLNISIALAATLLFSGCFSLRLGGGSSKKMTTENKTETTNVTLGQQLIDLKKAYDAGLISEREYNSQRKKLLSGKH